MKKHAIIPIFIPHIGCSESCVFCDQKQITARSKTPTVDEVRTTIDTWLSTLRTNSPSPEESNTVGTFTSYNKTDFNSDLSQTKIEIAFYGGSFTAIPISMQERYLSIAKEYIDRGLVSSIHLSTRPDCITFDILEMLASYGVRAIELGVQSFDDDVLTKSKRGHDADTVRQACKMIKEFRVFDLGIQLMIGLPGDSMAACIYSAKEAVKLNPTLARIYPTLVLEGTELMEMYRNGEYTPLTREDAISRSKAMYEILDAAGIYIMRVGLKSTDIINSVNLGDINSGAYHPAFRQLVEGRIARDKIEKLINDQFCMDIKPKVDQPDVYTNSTVDQPDVCAELTANQPDVCEKRFSLTILCSPRWISNAAGHNSENRKYFCEKYPLLDLHFREDPAIAPAEFRIIDQID